MHPPMSERSERPLVSYEPNPLLAWLYQRFFDHVVIDEAWADRIEMLQETHRDIWDYVQTVLARYHDVYDHAGYRILTRN